MAKAYMHCIEDRHGPKPDSQEAEAFTKLEAEAEALTLKKPASVHVW